MKYFILTLLIIISTTANAGKYDNLERLKNIVSLNSCDINIYNGDIKTKNCTLKEKSDNLTKEIEKQKKRRNNKTKKNIERRIDKKIDKILDKVFS